MTDFYLAVQTLGFATGTALFLLLAIQSLKANRLANVGLSWLWVAVLGLLWNLGGLARYVLLLGGVPNPSMPYRIADALAYSATAIWPTAMLVLLQQSVRWTSPWQAHIGRQLRRVSYVNAGALTLGFFIAALASHFPIRFGTLMQLSAYNLALHVAIGVVIFYTAKQRSFLVRTFSLAMILLMAGVVLSLIMLVHDSISGRSELVLSMIAQQSGIPMTVISCVFLARFRFADVFVKRSLVLLASVIFVFTSVVLLAEPFVQTVRASTPFPLAVSWIVVTIVCCALLLAFPILKGAGTRAADRWLFRRPDYISIAQAFSRESELLNNERELCALVEQRVRSALDVDVALLPLSEIEARVGKLDVASGCIMQLRVGDPARKLLGESEVEIIVPVEVDSTIAYLLAVAPGKRGRKLLGDELTFLSAVAQRLGRRTEALLFAREESERELREARLQYLVTEAELRALRAQVNPHFLFNTLNTILDLITTEPLKAEAMTERLAEVFRYVIARTERNLISVGEEFEFLRTYLEIEQARFGDRLRVEMSAAPSVTATFVPSLLLQPLVENAIRHGLAPKLDGGTLRISAVDEGLLMRLMVEDTGVGWRDSAESPAQLLSDARLKSENGRPSGGGIGLRNVSARLRALYGGHAEFSIRSEQGLGTSVCILIPKDEAQNPNHRRRGGSAVSATEVAE